MILGATPFLAFGAAQFGSALNADNLETNSAYAEAGAVAEEVLGAVRTVNAFNSQQRETERFAVQLDKAVEFGTKRGKLVGASIGR